MYQQLVIFLLVKGVFVNISKRINSYYNIDLQEITPYIDNLSTNKVESTSFFTLFYYLRLLSGF